MQTNLKKIISFLIISIVVLCFNNCSGGFKQEGGNSDQSSASGPDSPSNPPGENPPPEEDPDLPSPPPPEPPPVTGALKEIKVDGVLKSPTALDVVTTPSGRWPVSYLGPIEGGKAYLWKYESKPDWWSVCLVRFPNLDKQTDVDEQFYNLSLNGTVIPVSVLQGAMKCVDHSEPVTPSAEAIKMAVANKRVLPYRHAAFAGFRPDLIKFTYKRDKYNALGYNPSRLYGRSSANNSISYAISGQAGEYGSSRGFISSDDALLIASALDDKEAVFALLADVNRVQVLYGLSIPRLAIWSENQHYLRDPQHPFSGDRGYVNEGSRSGADSLGHEGTWTPPTGHPYLSQLGATAGTTYQHTRDEAHLFNHGFAYWLATGDPRAALLQQSIAAYALASIYTGGYADGRYQARFGYQRSTINIWNAMWKLRDVAMHVSAENDQIFWPKTRSLKMVEDILLDWRKKIAEMDAAPSSDAYSFSSKIFRGIDLNTDSAYSNFMIQGYGPESAYLFASAGYPDFMKRIGENFSLRLGRIGGARGVTCNAGSGYPVLASGDVLPYTSEDGFVNWINNTRCSTVSNSNMNGVGIHTAARAYWSARLAQDAVIRGWIAPVAGLDAAIKRAEENRDATTSWSSTGVLDWKHAGVPF